MTSTYRVLRDDGQLRTEVLEADLGDIDAVDDDGAFVCLYEAEEGQSKTGLAAARRSNDADLFAGVDLERDAVEHSGQLRGVAERQRIDNDFAACGPGKDGADQSEEAQPNDVRIPK